ncbi:MAG: tautomerase family protein [Actinobacteria bacterium]|nr:tautomerase family protein [Actinomycetota bacterium]
MPLVKIELVSGKNQEFKEKIMTLTGKFVVDVFELQEDDKNIRLLEYDKACFIMKSPYEYLIEITLFKGRNKETKKELYGKIVNTLEEKLGIEKDKIFIVLNEQPLENWGIRGGTSAEEVIG